MVPYASATVYDDFATQVGAVPAVWSLWSTWGASDRLFPDTGFLDHLHAGGTVPMVIWQPQDPLHPDSPKYRYRAITAGHFDAYIRTWARAAKDWGHPLLLRFAHEMDGYWFSWGIGWFNNTPATFIAAWRHIWNIFRGPGGVGATNVKFVWSPNAAAPKLYPGAKYVDDIGLSLFNWGSPRPWRTMADLYAAKMKGFRKMNTGKPFIVAETGSSTLGGNKVKWIAKGYPAVYAAYPEIKAIMYFNINATLIDPHQRDWMLTSNSGGLGAYRNIVAMPEFQGHLF